VTRVRRRAVWPDRGDLEILNAQAVAAARVGDEGDGQEVDEWYARGTPQEASLRHARILAAINEGARGDGSRQEPDADRGPLADAIRERVFAALAGREQVRGVVVQVMTCSRRGPRVRIRAWLDTGAIVTIERDEEDGATSPNRLVAAIVVAVERATTVQECDGDTTSFVGGAPCHQGFDQQAPRKAEP